jgi:hypothetical protein
MKNSYGKIRLDVEKIEAEGLEGIVGDEITMENVDVREPEWKREGYEGLKCWFYADFGTYDWAPKVKEELDRIFEMQNQGIKVRVTFKERDGHKKYTWCPSPMEIYHLHRGRHQAWKKNKAYSEKPA